METIQDAVRSFYARKDPGHDISHAMRVRNNAIYIAKKEGADREIVELAALLHDIGKESTLENSHAGSSANLAAAILEKYGYDIKVIDAVKHCIAVHSLEMGEPQTLEAKVVFDSDKLDYCGAIGLARLFAVAGAQGKSIYSVPGVKENSAEDLYMQKLRYFPDKLYTQTAREMLADNHQFALEFWQRLHRQINGPKE